MLDAITPSSAGLIVASIDLKRWGSGRAQVVAFVGAHDDWCELSTQAAERLLGISRGWAQRLLRGLVRDQVLEVSPGAGTRPNAYRPQPDITAWVGVPWLVDVELVAHRVRAFHAEQDRAPSSDDNPLVARSRTARLGVVVARSYTARRTRVVARSRTARLAGDQEGYPRGHRSARVARASRAVLERATSTPPPKEGSSSVFGGDGVGSSLRPRSSDELTVEEARAVRAIAHRASGAYLRGVVFDRAVALIERFGAEAVVAAVGRLAPVPATGVKGLLHDLGLELAAGDGPELATVHTLTDVDGRRQALERLVATYRAEGADVPADLQSELAELTSCDNGHHPGGTTPWP